MRKQAGRPQKTPIAVSLGAAVRALRIKSGLSQEQLAEVAGVSKNYVGNVERGEHEPSISVLNRIAKALETTASAVMRQAGL